MANFSNMTLEEHIRYNPAFSSLPPELELYLEELAHEMDEQFNAVRNLNRALEIAEEQAYFARELVESIKEVTKSHTRARNIKQAIDRLIESSYFET